MDAPLPLAEFAFPGPLRDALVAAILDGTKTSTTSLAVEYELDGEPLPRPGERSVLVDSNEQPLVVLEVTDIRLVPLRAVDLQHARDEGEGHENYDQWRTAMTSGGRRTRSSGTAPNSAAPWATPLSRWMTTRQ